MEVANEIFPSFGCQLLSWIVEAVGDLSADTSQVRKTGRVVAGDEWKRRVRKCSVVVGM
jgi:hypothetical protein